MAYVIDRSHRGENVLTLHFEAFSPFFQRKTMTPDPADQKMEKETGGGGMTSGQAKKTVVLGVLGVDAHVVGNKIMAHALESAGFQVVNIGTFSSQEDFIRAAIESAADALLVASLCGHGEIECRGFREKCVESGIGDIHLVAGGNLVVGKQEWKTVQTRFLEMGFNRAYPPGVSPRKVIDDLKYDLKAN
jgi:methylaspartate mutase sigma subunit